MRGEPVVILSKADLCEDPDRVRRQVQGLDSILSVEALNCLDPAAIQKLMPWCTARGVTLPPDDPCTWFRPADC